MSAPLRAVDIIMKKRGSPSAPHGQELTKNELEFIANGFVKGEIPDYQIAAWLMAVYFNGMSFQETADLTECMLYSGDTFNLYTAAIPGLTGPFIDKHSTGGVGDKISLPLAPIAAACGIQIPMMSGRALGHTGGTLDKLESIEGYRVLLEKEEMYQIMASTGYVMMGQTSKIVPADRLLYALRDVTGTVESIPLITASILSKKVAEGSDGLVFDVKCGTGAFMKTADDAASLAQSLVKTAHKMGKKASALITNMNTPLGNTVGNFLEIEETLDCLEGKGPEDVMTLTYALGAHMLLLADKADSYETGVEKCRHAVASGKAMELFLQNVAAQGGNPDKLLKQRGVRRSPYHFEYRAAQDGWITIEAFKTGLAAVNLGVGRNRTDDKVDPDAGMILRAHTGEYVKKDDVLIDVYGKNESSLTAAAQLLDQAVTYSDTKTEPQPLIYQEICS